MDWKDLSLLAKTTDGMTIERGNIEKRQAAVTGESHYLFL
jgi:hypothetical protein